MSRAMRFFFTVSATVIWLGILLTGLDVARWLLFIPAIFFPFAAVTGICPGLIISRRLFPERDPR